MKIFIKTFGCRVNQIESESLLENFERAGHSITDDFHSADICLLNTCTVTAQADKDAQKILRLVSARNPKCKIIATGCYASVDPEGILRNAPSAQIVPNQEKENIAAKISPLCEGKKGFAVSGHRGHCRAFVKIQDGCGERCAYCIVPLARAQKSSKPSEDVIAEITGLIKNGFKEIVLCGINIGNYLCPKSSANLAKLLKKVLALEGNFRIRLSSVEAGNITEELLSAAQTGGEKFCRYFHLPLQCASDKVLADMGRKYNSDFFAGKVGLIRSVFPDAGLFDDVIAAYPTETEDDFAQTLSFIKKINFSGLHVFRFSPRPKTKAAGLKPLPVKESKERANVLRAIDA
ncbi:MAG: MiaB/RimO family radical SAM methylthiotransferase, partial [Elusimicrobia bacterium]|nr:MiaB/RimO family radical SAM methylthiotransferase [Elusimicrobiota bacterium]